MSLLSPGDYQRTAQALSARQRELAAALADKNTALRDMYVGALRTLEDPDNADRFAQAGHSLRELSEKLPESYNPPSPEQADMNNKVQNLGERWTKMRRNTECAANGVWAGTIDSHLSKFLDELSAFFEWVRTARSKRKEQRSGCLRKADPIGLPLPSQIEHLRILEWSHAHDFFTKACHHRMNPISEEEFRRWLAVLEDFVLDMLRPRTFDKQSEIDAIISRGES